MFKKILAILIGALTICAACALCAGAETSGDYEYIVLDDGTVAITDYTGSASNLTIPSTLGGKKVTVIADSAFVKCESLSSVTIPYGVIDVGNFSFGVCSNLKSITIPDSVKIIDSMAFAYCSNLTSIKIPDSVTMIGQDVFTSTPILDNQTTAVKYVGNWAVAFDKTEMTVTLKSGTVGIANSTFEDSQITSIYIPDSTRYIGTDAFSLCPELTAINLSDNSKYLSLQDGIFYNNDKTKTVYCMPSKKGKIVLPDSVKIIGYRTFSNCKDITSVVIPDGVTIIEDDAFCYCDSLASVNIPDSVTSIGAYAFMYCLSLTSINIPDSVMSIDQYAFAYCENLTSVSVPDSVTKIGRWVFAYTPFLENQKTTVKYAGKWVIGWYENATTATIKSGTIGIADYAFEYCNFTSIEIPDSVKSIGYRAFRDCSSLESVTIPDSVTSIGYLAFDYCSDDLVIYGHSGSTAEKYAKDNEIKFVATDLPTVGNISKFSLDSRGVNSLKLSWSKASGATGYELEIQKNGKWSKAATISSGATVSYTITGLSAGTYYPLRVRAFVKSGGNTVYSAWKTGSVNTSPSNMTGFKLASRGVNSVKLSWTKNTSASGYQVGVYKGGKWVSYTVKGSGTTSYTVSGLSAGTKYNVRVRAYKTNGSSTIYGAWKTGSANTSPSNMTGFKLASRGVNSVKLSWTKNTSASGYQVGVYKGGKWVSYTVKGNGTTSYTVSGLSAGTKYNVRVRAYKTNGSSTIYGAWKTGSVITAPSNMTGFKLKSKTTGSLTLQWSKNSSATGYQLQIQKNGKWVSYTVKGNSTTSCAIKSLSKNTKYNLRIRAYKIIDSSTIYGAWKNGSASTKK